MHTFRRQIGHRQANLATVNVPRQWLESSDLSLLIVGAKIEVETVLSLFRALAGLRSR